MRVPHPLQAQSYSMPTLHCPGDIFVFTLILLSTLSPVFGRVWLQKAEGTHHMTGQIFEFPLHNKCDMCCP